VVIQQAMDDDVVTFTYLTLAPLWPRG